MIGPGRATSPELTRNQVEDILAPDHTRQSPCTPCPKEYAEQAAIIPTGEDSKNLWSSEEFLAVTMWPALPSRSRKAGVAAFLVLQVPVGYQSFLAGPGAIADGLFLVKVTEIARRWRSQEESAFVVWELDRRRRRGARDEGPLTLTLSPEGRGDTSATSPLAAVPASGADGRSARPSSLRERECSAQLRGRGDTSASSPLAAVPASGAVGRSARPSSLRERGCTAQPGTARSPAS